MFGKTCPHLKLAVTLELFGPASGATCRFILGYSGSEVLLGSIQQELEEEEENEEQDEQEETAVAAAARRNMQQQLEEEQEQERSVWPPYV